MKYIWEQVLNLLAGAGIFAIILLVYGTLQLKDDKLEARLKQPVKQVVVKK